MKLFLSVFILSTTQTLGCTWNEAQAKITTPDISKVYYTSGCYQDIGNDIETVFFSFVGKGIVWMPAEPSKPQENGHYSVTCNSPFPRYVRLFANQTNYASTGNDIYGINISTWNYFVSGSVNAWQVAPGVFQMKLTLPAERTYNVHLLPGMEQCSMSLEDLKLSDFIKCADKPFDCDDMCKRVEMNYHPKSLADFTVTTPTTNFQEKTSSAIEDGASCQFYDKPGAWDKKPVHWRSGALCSSKQYECDGMMSRGEPAKSRQVDSLCTIGDSHLARAFRPLVSMTKTCVIKFKSLTFFPHSLDIREKAPVLHSPKQSRSLLDNMRLCHNFTTQYNSGKSSAIVWSIGSHTAKFSPKQLAALVTDSTKSFRKVSATVQPCVLVVGIPASNYETIPEKFGNYFKWFQNPWRAKAQNYAIRGAVAKIPNYHYIDIFDESLAIYYDGHYDAVHMSQPFYSYLANMIIYAAKMKCL
jgi:hypothetical protein